MENHWSISEKRSKNAAKKRKNDANFDAKKP
jgi:hypothetical protein